MVWSIDSQGIGTWQCRSKSKQRIIIFPYILSNCHFFIYILQFCERARVTRGDLAGHFWSLGHRFGTDALFKLLSRLQTEPKQVTLIQNWPCTETSLHQLNKTLTMNKTSLKQNPSTLKQFKWLQAKYHFESDLVLKAEIRIKCIGSKDWPACTNSPYISWGFEWTVLYEESGYLLKHS